MSFFNLKGLNFPVKPPPISASRLAGLHERANMIRSGSSYALKEAAINGKPIE